MSKHHCDHAAFFSNAFASGSSEHPEAVLRCRAGALSSGKDVLIHFTHLQKLPSASISILRLVSKAQQLHSSLS